MRRFSFCSLTFAALSACILLSGLSSVASATPKTGTRLTKLKPSSGPEYAESTVQIKGKGFSTTPGETTVSFGGTPASSVKCASSTMCVATTPELPEGPVAVTVTTGSSTSMSRKFTFVKYEPPRVAIISKKGIAQFEEITMLTDLYPGIFAPGNVYLQIPNRTTSSQTVDTTTAISSFTLEPGQTEGLNIPTSMVPYTFTIVGSSSPKATLTVKTTR